MSYRIQLHYKHIANMTPALRGEVIRHISDSQLEAYLQLSVAVQIRLTVHEDVGLPARRQRVAYSKNTECEDSHERRLFMRAYPSD